MPQPEPISGVLVIDKPEGPTSHDIVGRAHRVLKTKAGHTGTLDPMATGVLPLVVGRATRLSQFLQMNEKEYLAELKLGTSTDTLDREGKVVRETPIPQISRKQTSEILSSLVGEIRQQAPLFSAVKVRGRKLYEMARRKEAIEGPWRTVSIYRLELIEQSHDTWKLHVECSAGTYIRSLARDIGERIGCAVHLGALRRLRAGTFDLSRSLRPEEIESRWQEVLYPMEDLLTQFPKIELDDARAERIRHGNEVSVEGLERDASCRIFHNRQLIAIGQVCSRNMVRPSVVLRPVK